MSNYRVARLIVADYLETKSNLPIMSLSQAYELVVKETKGLKKESVEGSITIISNRAYRRDTFINNFYGKRVFALTHLGNGDFAIHLLHTASSAQQKIVDLIERHADNLNLQEKRSNAC